VSCTTAGSHLEASSCEAGAAAELAASNKVVKYAGLSSPGEFVPIAVESHDPINRDALQFLNELGKRLVETTGDVRASSFLFQRISVVVLRFNSVLLHDSFVGDDQPEWDALPNNFYSFFFNVGAPGVCLVKNNK